MTQHVLVVDDSQTIHRAVAALLETEPVTLTSAYDEQQAFDAAITGAPDVILLDVGLGELGGLELCRRLKGDPRTAAVPVIFLTGETDVATKVAGFELGAVDYVTKPFEPSELRARVRAALRTKRFQDLLARRAQIDGLTGLWNREHFDRRLAEEAAVTRRYGRPFCLVMLDLDHFKALNDEHGHPFGDRVLQAVADVVMRTVRDTDVPCRYGGEELALVLPHQTKDGGGQVAERLRAAVEALALRVPTGVVKVTASFGLAASGEPGPALEPAALLEAADTALYRAKHEGRNRVVCA